MTFGCEPCLGDIGCLEANEDEEQNMTEQMLKQLKIEDSGLTVGPKELERMIFELAVTYSKEEMKERCSNFVSPHFERKA